jgi:hypothetical protein
MNDKYALPMLALVVGYILLQKPNCNRGCKTIAEHLVTDGLRGIASGLFA